MGKVEISLAPEAENWPGKRVLFVCSANLGRSQIAEGLFKKYFPDVPVCSAGILDYTGLTQPHSLVINVMKEQGINLSPFYVKVLTPERIASETDIVVLTDPGTLMILHPYVTKKARSVIAINIADPSDPNQFPGQRYSMKSRIFSTYQVLDKLISQELKSIMLKVRNDEYKDLTLNSIIYPFGLPAATNLQTSITTEDFIPMIVGSSAEFFGPPL